MQLVCPQCAAINRLAEHKPALAARCGKCGKALFNQQPLNVTQAQFDRHLQKSDIHLVVDFWALVLHLYDIYVCRAHPIGQGKAQAAGNGSPFSRTATQNWPIGWAPFGRVNKRSSALLRFLELAKASPSVVRLAAKRFLTRCIRKYHRDGVLRCGPCKMMAPSFQQAATRIEPRARLLKVNTEQEQGLSARYAIRSIPTLMVFSAGQEVARMSGALDLGNLLSWINNHI